MCVEISQNQFNKMEITASNKKNSYSLRKMVKQLFKQNKSQHKKVDSMESLENKSNISLEVDCLSMESLENYVNELHSSQQSFGDDEDVTTVTTVPVHYIRTTEGTFFWTSSVNQITC
ncbi:enhancer of split m4 protein-like [Haematobia irritans]|uniref:enhancer of split m4 protein-like n=1 Tax=Haematobia irritans TaxID=7368 RepID=UPI003F501C49